MPRVTRIKPLGIAFTLYEAWKRLPPQHRARLIAIAREQGMKAARRHGPRVAASLARRRLGPKP